MYRKYLKRALDLFLSTIGLIVLLPIMIVIYFLILISMKTNPIFAQSRPGLNEEVFLLYKFKTMTDERDESGALLPDAKRLTKFGIFLRKTSLDELPQLWNIMIGDMSIIGPRPLLVSYLPLYTPEQHRRHSVRPGLFGLAGVQGRNNQTWESKFHYDIEYVDNVSFCLDAKIFLKCVGVVLSQRGVSETGNATASAFLGTGRK